MNKKEKQSMNSIDTTEKLKRVLWKVKRSLEDINWDDTIDHYVISETEYERIVNRINQVLGVKPIKKGRRYD